MGMLTDFPHQWRGLPQKKNDDSLLKCVLLSNIELRNFGLNVNVIFLSNNFFFWGGDLFLLSPFDSHGAGSNCSDSVFPWQLKRWERKECKPNSLPVLHKMHVKAGDTVKVIAGCDKGKIGEITKVFRHNSTVMVKDINLKTKHVKKREEEEQGQIIKVYSLICYFIH